MKTSLFLCFLAIVFNSCNYVSEGKLKLEDELGKDKIRYFPKGTLNHFPKYFPNSNSATVISQNTSESHPHIWVKFIAQKERFDSLQNAVTKIAIAKYKSDDSCLIVIDKHLREDNWLKFDKTLRVPVEKPYNDNPCAKGKLALPNFYCEGFVETSSILTGLIGYEMYVIDAKPGIFMDSTKLPNGLYTPKGWKHGFSKGVALREADHSVIYWFDIW